MSSARLRFAASGGKARTMEKKPKALLREERLAAQLRENLKRRKLQARALGEQDNAPLPKGPAKS